MENEYVDVLNNNCIVSFHYNMAHGIVHSFVNGQVGIWPILIFLTVIILLVNGNQQGGVMVSTFQLDLGLRRSIGVARRWICNHFIYSAIKYSDIKFVIVKLIL